MVKSIISIICASVIIIAGAFYENYYITDNFDRLKESLTVLYEKIEEETAVKDDVYAVQKQWLAEKKNLHAFIPHTEIKEIDLWLAETVTLVGDKEWADAVSKIEVLIELTEQIPMTFKLTFGNIF